MKIVYIAKANLPSKEANSVHVMKLSEELTKLSDDFKLIVPCSLEKWEDRKIEEYYGIKCEIAPLFVKRLAIKRWLYNYYFAWRAVSLVKDKRTIVITRDPLTAFFSVMRRLETVLDIHGDVKHLCGRAYRMMYWKPFVNHKKFHLVTISKGLKDYYCTEYRIPEHRICVLHDGCTISNFEEVEKKPLLNDEALKIGYCGSFFLGKGLGVIQQLAQKDLKNKYFMWGGTKEEAEKVVGAEFSNNVEFGGYLANSSIPKALAQQDILLLPNQEKQVCRGEDIGKFTSPLKMFEYMACGRIIVASRLPVLGEVLNDDNSYLVDAADADAWLACIQHIQNEPEEARRKAKKAQQDVLQYTWKRRAEQMLDLCK